MEGLQVYLYKVVLPESYKCPSTCKSKRYTETITEQWMIVIGYAEIDGKSKKIKLI